MITKIKLKQLYLLDHLTYQEIGDLYNIGRQSVFYWIKKYGIDTSTGERFKVTCDTCGKLYSIQRKQWRKHKKHYCTSLCYFQAKNKNYTPSRWGQMKARKAMSKHLGRKLGIREIVHHEDTDCNNNELSNLRLFANHSEHMTHHHSLRTDVP